MFKKGKVIETKMNTMPDICVNYRHICFWHFKR